MAEEDVFCSQEKEQKTLMSLSRCSPATYAKETKVFGSRKARAALFFKKELLSCFRFRA
jgi:hypothetical protein